MLNFVLMRSAFYRGVDFRLVNYRKYIIASTRKVRAHLKGLECARMFFFHVQLCSFSIRQSINKLYLSTELTRGSILEVKSGPM